MKNVLVFPCGSEIGLEIYNAVKYSTHFHLIGGSSTDDHGKFVYDDYISGIPYVTDKEFIPHINELIKQYNIDAIYPTMDLVIAILKSYEKELGCTVISSDIETTEICLSKEKMFDVLKGVVKLPKSYNYESINADDLPVFLKPKIGYGGRGTSLVGTMIELENAASGRDDLQIVEYLPGKEYTVDCFTNRHGTLLYYAGRERNRIRMGISVNTFFADNQEEFRPLVESINKRMIFRGAWFAQFKRNRDGELCLMEVATRLGGSSALSRAKGVNFPLLSLFDAFDYDVKIQENDYDVILDRALANKYKLDIDYSAVYVDYDDCLILKKKEVNLNLVRFLYKCINTEKRIILLTKHDGDLVAGMKRFRIEDIFDEVIHIEKTDDKSYFIEEKNAIFIDDSYEERENIKTKLNIPVFSPDMIEVL